MCGGARVLTLPLPAPEGSRAEENTTFQCPHLPLQSPPPWAPIPAHQALPVLSPFSIKECYTTTTPSSISPLPLPVSLAQMQVCSPQNMPPLPSCTVHEEGAGEELCPQYVGCPLPSFSQGPGLCSLLSWGGVRGNPPW